MRYHGKGSSAASGTEVPAPALGTSPCDANGVAKDRPVKESAKDGDMKRTALAWSCGIVLFVLAAGRKPFRDDDFMNLYRLICRGEYRCPRWFSTDLVRMVRRLLQPNPAHRITIPQVMETSWFKMGFKEVSFYIHNKDCLRSIDGPEEPDLYDSDGDGDADTDTTVSSSPGSSSPVAGAAHAHGDGGMHTSASAPSLVDLGKTGSAGAQQPMRRIKSLNAFDIIASSPSFDLSGLFEVRGEQMRFVSGAPVPTIISKLEEIAGQVSFTARTKECQVSFEATRNGTRARSPSPPRYSSSRRSSSWSRCARRPVTPPSTGSSATTRSSPACAASSTVCQRRACLRRSLLGEILEDYYWG